MAVRSFDEGEQMTSATGATATCLPKSLSAYSGAWESGKDVLDIKSTPACDLNGYASRVLAPKATVNRDSNQD